VCDVVEPGLEAGDGTWNWLRKPTSVSCRIEFQPTTRDITSSLFYTRTRATNSTLSVPTFIINSLLLLLLLLQQQQQQQQQLLLQQQP